MVTQTRSYVETSWVLMAKAEEALAQGDLIQASRKGWRAAAWMLRGFAREKGWRYSGFRRLYEVMDLLADNYPPAVVDDIDLWFDAATALEINAYENTDSRLGVEICLADVAKLLCQLERLSD